MASSSGMTKKKQNIGTTKSPKPTSEAIWVFGSMLTNMVEAIYCKGSVKEEMCKLVRSSLCNLSDADINDGVVRVRYDDNSTDKVPVLHMIVIAGAMPACIDVLKSRKNIDVNKKDSKGDTILTIACKQGDPKLAETLIKELKADRFKPETYCQLVEYHELNNDNAFFHATSSSIKGSPPAHSASSLFPKR